MLSGFKQSPLHRFKPGLLATSIALALLAMQSQSVQAAEDKTSAFELGTVLVTAKRLPQTEVGETGDQVASVLTAKDIQQYNRNNIGDALNLLSGVSLSTNARNEKTIAVRGFDSRQVPLFIDGIPVYVPYDGYVDFNRFTTADLAAIQLAKGFSSMAYGPNTLGGAINLISRKPRAALEGDAIVSLGSGSERQAAVNLGGKQGIWYWQTALSYLQSDTFSLSGDFVPTSSENGGSRNNAYRKDSKFSFKLGLTPNAGDEYAISYYKQNGEKGQPPSTVPAAARYWKWPYWDKESLYFISNITLGEHESVKLRLYHDSYGNEVDTYTNDSYTTLKTSGSGSVSTGRSIYDDHTNGASLTLESTRLSSHTLRLIGHYKADEHKELDGVGTLNTRFKDVLMSIAAEDNIQLSQSLLLSLGLGRHELRPDSVFSLGNPYSLPRTQSASDAQAGLFYTLSNSARLYGSIAQKNRLTTLKDRYSQRLGTFIENPDLQPERALNMEVGYQGQPWQGAKAEAAVFYSDVSNKIQTVANVVGTKSQMQNAGKVRISGIEAGLSSSVNQWLELGGNYTFTDLNNISNPATRLTDIPRHKLTAHATLHPMEQVDITAYVENNSSRWVSNTLELPGFTTLNLKLAYQPMKNLNLEAGVTNLTDKNYALADGFPNAGRMWFANLNCRF
ncbi:TonB-dependent receptor plug domain-containing protein [Undibacterium sp. Tian12W]|uniref:TonB-dependent receptor plug domain-containing protein n=1 Tax=Undibacterium sp. Tian12W TaxID=3413054 RepID=UPI003BEFC24D